LIRILIFQATVVVETKRGFQVKLLLTDLQSGVLELFFFERNMRPIELVVVIFGQNGCPSSSSSMAEAFWSITGARGY
jgi:hypothetical protein